MQTKIVKTDPDKFDPQLVREAAVILQKGGIVAFPTETVYGLAADYDNKDALERLYSIKRRPRDKPFTIHIAHKADITKYIDEPDELTTNLIDKFWPGPVTIIVKSKSGEKLGFRMPAGKLALELIKESGRVIVAPSANVSGEPDPVEPFSVVKTFDGLIDMVIDAGPTRLRTSSTIVDISRTHPKILRRGPSADEIKAFLGEEEQEITNILVVCAGNSCRSPMAEGLLKRELAGEGFNIKSAGTIAINGLSPSPESIEIMKRFASTDISKYSSNKLTEDLVEWADLILVMDRAQKSAVERIAPEAADKTHLLKEYAGTAEGGTEVPDPIGAPFIVYEETFKTIDEAVTNIAKKLRKG